jgi:hypothetical protein
MGVTPEPALSALRRAVLSTAEHLHRVACDLVYDVDHELRPVLRAAARRLDEPALAALAGAAAARMHIRAFQAAEALDLVRERLAGPRCPPAARGLLRWVEGDALMIQGSGDTAHEAHLLAAADFHIARAPRALVTMASRCAEEWVSRGEPDRATRWLTLARGELSRRPDARSLAEVARIAGLLSVSLRRDQEAAVRFSDALDILAQDADARRERALVRLGQSALFMIRGDFVAALEAVDAAEADTEGHAALDAAVAWRRAELGLRGENLQGVALLLARASAGFRRIGSLRGLLMVARAEGDLAALMGDRHAAIRAWNQALGLCLRTRNLPALHRVLQRRAGVEAEGIAGPHVGEILDHLDQVTDLLSA